MTAKTATPVPFPFIPDDVFSIIKAYAVPKPVSWVKKLDILKPKMQKYLEKKTKAVCYDFAKGLYASTGREHYKWTSVFDRYYKETTKEKILDEIFGRTYNSALINKNYYAEGGAPFCLYEKGSRDKQMDDAISSSIKCDLPFTDRMLDMVARHNDPVAVEKRKQYAEEIAEKYVKHIEYFLLNGKSANP
jgi:hypothetical protein